MPVAENGFANGILFKSEILAKENEKLGLTDTIGIFDESEYHSIASKVYEIREALNKLGDYKLSPDEQKILLALLKKIPEIKEKETERVDKRITELQVSSLSTDEKQAELKKLEAERARYVRIQDALKRHIDHIFKDNNSRLRTPVKEEPKVEPKPAVEFNPALYREKELREGIESYDKTRLLTKVFGRKDVVLVDNYDQKHADEVIDDITLVQETIVELENEAINVAGDPGKSAQINDIIIPGLRILEAKLEKIRDAKIRESTVFKEWVGELTNNQVFTDLRDVFVEAVFAKEKGSASYAELTAVLAKLETSLQAFTVWSADEVKKLSNEAMRLEAKVLIGKEIGVQNKLVEDLKGEIFGLWKKDIDANPKFTALKRVISKALDVADPSSSIPTNKDIEDQEDNLNSALAALNPLSEWTFGLPSTLQDSADKHIQEKLKEVEKKSVREKLQKRKKEILDAETDKDKKTLQEVVTEIEKLDDNNNKTHQQLLDLKTRLHAVRDGLQKRGIAFVDVDSRFDKQEDRLRKFIERAEIAELSFAELVEIVIAQNYDPFKSTADQANITDPYEREIIKRFQAIYFPTAAFKIEVHNADGSIDQDKTKEARREHKKIKTRIWAYRYQDEHYGGQYVPAANPDQLYGEAGKMTTRKLFREDILEGVMNEEAYGPGPREMLKYAVDVVADEVEVVEIDASGQRIKPYHYDSLQGNPDGPALFKSFLHKQFVETGRVTEEIFVILWDLYVCFDLASVSLAKLQKGTKTRSHNAGTTADAQAFRCYPMEFMSHKRNRYGNLDVAQQHLLIFTGEYPKKKRPDFKDPSKLKFVWAGNREAGGGSHVRTVDETQKLIKLYMEAYFPLKGIENSIYPGDAGDEIWSKCVFPDQLEFLTEKSLDKIADPKRYQLAQTGWDQMLELTIGDIGSQLTIDKIFNTNDGLYTKFINGGMGLAKVTVGDHYKWFVPMLRYFVGRISAEFKGDDLTERKELRNKLVEQLEISVTSGLGKLDSRGSVIGPVDAGITDFIEELKQGSSGVTLAERLNHQWAEIPEILRPWEKMRRSKRIAYMKAWYHDKTGRNAPSPEVDFKRLNLSGDQDITTYYKAINEQIPLPKIVDRSAKSKDTSEKK